MVIALVIVFFVLLVAAIVFVEAGDVLAEKFFPRNGEAAREAPLPFLIIPTTPNDLPIPTPRPAAASGVATWFPSGEQRDAAPAMDAPSFGGDGAGGDAGGDAGEYDNATIVFRRPLDEPMQLLPGRLQVVAGEPGREEIRFFGSLGEQARIVLGREGGPAHRVITLASPTVSRRHARLDFRGGEWWITNLSRTNPVLVNDETLSSAGGAARVLVDGDRIELGEVMLRFHAR